MNMHTDERTKQQEEERLR